MATIGTLERVSAATLSKLILAEAAAEGDPTIAVVDVRDDDYIGGHIKGAQNVPSRTLDVMLPTLVRKLQYKETVVFHCALSQQRGPGAALQYIRERERMIPSGEVTKPVKQRVVVLDRGFVGWQEEYGTDERLTEGYRKELWEDGYWG
ncbi:Rhodanese-like domain-containing protein [Cercophora newfieldiana]|uniref:Rhodanese-like domain-containing protein n=1 Tax=Cercophora newfieldiana TaxID=92897 RepID=A0AA40CK36_9PEZI|nr:Rhodanese-like domain-containing protein [Cercophora newfieldiana]